MYINLKNTINCPSDFSLFNTLSSGQTFVWQFIDGYWVGSTIKGLIILIQDKNIIRWGSNTQDIDNNFISNYLGLDYSIDDFESQILKDEYIHSAYSNFKGLRILHQDPIETIISFIISANKNISAIKSSIKKLSTITGNRINFEDKVFYTFPTINSLSKLSIAELKSCSLGYRAEYIYETISIIKDWDFIGNIPNSTHNLRSELIKLKGIGPKVADCIMVYGFGQRNIIPIDVWIKRAMNQIYKVPIEYNYNKTQEIIQQKFGEHAALIGQYLYENIKR